MSILRGYRISLPAVAPGWPTTFSFSHPPNPGFSRMTLSSHRLKASTSFFTVKAGRRPFLHWRSFGKHRGGQPVGPFAEGAPIYTAGSCYDNSMEPA